MKNTIPKETSAESRIFSESIGTKGRTYISQLGVENISASKASRIPRKLDEEMNEFLSKPIEQEIKYLFVDATYLRLKEH